MSRRREGDIGFDAPGGGGSREARGGRRGGRGRSNRGGDDDIFGDSTEGKRGSSGSDGGFMDPSKGIGGDDSGSSGRRGRRDRGGDSSSGGSKLADAFGDGDSESRDEGGQKSPGAPPKPSSGWGDASSEGKSNDRSRSRRGGGSNNSDSASADAGRRKGRNYFDDDGSDDEIPTIPDLEDEEEEMVPLEVQIANAPKNVDRRTVNLRELTSEVKHLLPEQGKGVDLSLLTATLCPQEVCVEPDIEWRFDSLFEQTCQDIHAEEEAAEETKLANRKKKGSMGGDSNAVKSRGEGSGGTTGRGSRRRGRGGSGKTSEKSDRSP